jgi:hypothetical protein
MSVRCRRVPFCQLSARSQQGGRWMPLRRCRTAIMFSALNFSPPYCGWRFGAPCRFSWANNVCPRAADKSVTYRSVRCILLAAQCRRQANYTRVGVERGPVHPSVAPPAPRLYGRPIQPVCLHSAGQIEHGKHHHRLSDDATHRSCNEHSALRQRRRIRHAWHQARLVRNGGQRKTLIGAFFQPTRMSEWRYSGNE